jgi:hypothetical protein
MGGKLVDMQIETGVVDKKILTHDEIVRLQRLEQRDSPRRIARAEAQFAEAMARFPTVGKTGVALDTSTKICE